MNKKKFIEAVQRQCPPGLVQHAPMAVDSLESIVKYENWDISKVIQFIPRMLSLMKSSTDKDYLSGGKLNAHALLSNNSLAESLKPEIKAIRKTYFGSEEPPFGSFKEAESWLEPIESELFSRAASLEFGGKECELEPPSQEAEMWDEVQRKLFALSHRTGISPNSLEYYVLADIKPLSLPYEIRMPGREYCTGKRKCYYVDIKVYTELEFEELLEIYHTVKEALGVKKGKRFNEKHLEIYTMVQEQGGAPQGKGTVAFWKCLQEEWNERHGNGDEYTTWKGIKRAYDLIHKKLNAQYQIKGANDERSHS
jgi:hypothetical protein